jgi:UDP-glucose 4-epimerase
VKAFEEANDLEIPYEIVERRDDDIAFCYADVPKAERELDWTAERDIKDMCRDAWRF